MKRLEWLGFLSDEPLPLQQGSVFDVLLAQMLKKMSYGDTERDMVALQDEFIVEYPGGRASERITSTLIDYGVPGGDSAVARTVGIPAAIATKLVLQGRIDLKGVHIPVDPAIYEPVLKELAEHQITVREKTGVLN
jgi:saccharopine dehydrogenase-like NADP-dependent oxidoreductase